VTAPVAPAPAKPTPAKPSAPVVAAPNATSVAGAIAYARSHLGDAYTFAGAGPTAWDCSGLTKAAYASVGTYIGTHSATNQYNTLKRAGRLVPLSAMVAGDLLWYSNGGSESGDKYHVAIYTGGGQMIEAPYEGQVVRVTAVRRGDLVQFAGRPTP
jgi:cell wall-associated NlpC family hydrolase